MNTTIMYLVGYDSSRRKMMNAGWGCGYVMIPKTHPVVINWLADKAANALLPEEDRDFWNFTYLTIAGIGEEITYTESKTVNDIEYIVIGFDTAHSYNGDHNDFDWVFNKTAEIKKVIDAIKE